MQAPLVGHQDVVLLLGQAQHPDALLGPLHLRQGIFGHGHHAAQVAVVRGSSLTGLVQHLQRVLANRLEHPVAGLAGAVLLHHQQ